MIPNMILSDLSADQIRTFLKPETHVWHFSESQDDAPCDCCHPMIAMDDNLWECCETGRTWKVLDAKWVYDRSHSVEECYGSCPHHPLVSRDLVPLHLSEAYGLSWGDYHGLMEQLRNLTESAAEKAARDAAKAKEDRDMKLRAEASERERYTEIMKHRAQMGTSKGEGPKKLIHPCKNLYIIEKAPKSEWVQRGGKLCPPSSRALTGSECWAWEYKDPRTGQMKAPHTCMYQHPGEVGWHKEWLKDSKWRPEGDTATVSSHGSRPSHAHGHGHGHGHALPTGWRSGETKRVPTGWRAEPSEDGWEQPKRR